MTTALEAVKVFPSSTDEIRADVLPYMPEARAKVAAAYMNTLEKAARRSEILNAPCMEFSVNQEEARREERRKNWAEYNALKETAAMSDLTPERKEYLIKRATEELSKIDWYWAGYSQVRDIEEENLSLEKPSRTQEILKERYETERSAAAALLSYTLSQDDIQFLNTLFTKRYRRTFQIAYHETGFRPYREPTGLVDLRVTHWEFGDLVKYKARTLREVKRLLEIWATPYRVARRAEGTAIVCKRFEIWEVDAQ